LLEAYRLNAARTLFEETGIDKRHCLDDIHPAVLRSEVTGDVELGCELHSHMFFFLSVTDDDFAFKGNHPPGPARLGLKSPLGAVGSHLLLRLSFQFSGFLFEGKMTLAAEKIRKQNRGICSKALAMAMEERKKVVKKAKQKVNEAKQRENEAKQREIEAKQSTATTQILPTSSANTIKTERKSKTDLPQSPKIETLSINSKPNGGGATAATEDIFYTEFLSDTIVKTDVPKKPKKSVLRFFKRKSKKKNPSEESSQQKYQPMND